MSITVVSYTSDQQTEREGSAGSANNKSIVVRKFHNLFSSNYIKLLGIKLQSADMSTIKGLYSAYSN